MTKLILFIVAATVNIYSCNSSDTTIKKISSKEEKPTKSQLHWDEILSGTNNFVIQRYYLNPDSNITRCVNCQTWSDSTKDPKAVSIFRQMFTDVDNRGYSCCPYSYYSITFFKDKNKIGVYYVDTARVEGKSVFFDGSYQTSYIIDNKDWIKFLKDYMNYR